MFKITRDKFKLDEVFTISRGSKTHAEVLTFEIDQGASGRGRGECVPYARYGETLDSVEAQIQDYIDNGDSARFPPGAARNAIECAILDAEAKCNATTVWEMLRQPVPQPVTSAFTLSLDTPEKMRASAAKHAARPLLKIKLGTADDMARLEAVRAGAPKAAIIVDANEGWTAEIYTDLAPHLLRLGVQMVEQPLPAGQDDMLSEIARPLPVCADESCHDRASLPDLKGKYDMVNIKLDKTGGLSEALALRDAARAEGYTVMVGCMVGSSLAMAPAMLVAQGAEIVDLDGPLLLAEDRTPPLKFDGSTIHPPEAALWG
ncbi:N-acetyl-D-Glu racemase DgcA [Jannaschia sp. CCS1]|uniref:N-acetyl-D-Glu racemase DgcA n=1 Tax=Jannaschia sp. (strain CCS1) TaxID=290400 RepID=UPI000053D3A2|nr:N-acetyl-D-Glu racemase DgcA [Jannaschia sp. CCS1]ABD53282.1 mandelate racemase/muconate lactonizing enzyme [Jannaschia sp. CCS1]